VNTSNRSQPGSTIYSQKNAETHIK